MFCKVAGGGWDEGKKGFPRLNVQSHEYFIRKTKLLSLFSARPTPARSMLGTGKKWKTFQFTFIYDFQIYKIKCDSLKMVNGWNWNGAEQEEVPERNLKNMERFVSQSRSRKN